MIDLDQILDGLIQRTSEGKLHWSISVRDNQFVTSVDAISIVIRRQRELYQLEILDEAGQTVETLQSVGALPGQREKLLRLFTLARRSGLKVDSTLEKLAKALEL